MKLGFFDWIRNKGWHDVGAEQAVTLGPRSADRDIRLAIDRLLDRRQASDARLALDAIKSRAAPLIEAAVRESKFRESTAWPDGRASTALEMMLDVLDGVDSPTPLREAERLWNAAAWQHRCVAATYLPRTGRSTYTPQILALLQDEDPITRDRAIRSMAVAAKAGRVDATLADAVYRLLRPWALRVDRGPGAEAAELMLLLDRARAVADLSVSDALDVRLNWLHHNLTALHAAGIHVPATELSRLLNSSLDAFASEADSTRISHWSGQAAAIISILAARNDPHLPPRLGKLIEHADESVRRAALDAVLDLAGVDPIGVVFDEPLGLAGLNATQRIYFLIRVLDNEVCNGGFLQYLSNSYGRDVVAAQQALTRLGAADAAANVAAVIGRFGAAGVPVDRDARNDRLARLIPDDESPFDANDARWYADADRINTKLGVFAARHPDDFRKRGPAT